MALVTITPLPLPKSFNAQTICHVSLLAQLCSNENSVDLSSCNQQKNSSSNIDVLFRTNEANAVGLSTTIENPSHQIIYQEQVHVSSLMKDTNKNARTDVAKFSCAAMVIDNEGDAHVINLM